MSFNGAQGTNARIAALRASMLHAGCSAYLIPNSDPHADEYLPAHFGAREYFSGFCCENSNFAVTRTGSALWVDGRYFVAAEQALAGTEITLQRMGEPGVPTVEAWCAAALQPGEKLGCCAENLPERDWRRLDAALQPAGAALCALHLEDELWTEDRPPLPAGRVWMLPQPAFRAAPAARLARVRAAVRSAGGTALLLTRLDDIAWLTCLRGSDLHCTPYALAFAWLTQEKAVLFLNAAELQSDARRVLEAAGFEVRPYADTAAALAQQTDRETVLADPACTSAALYAVLAANPALTVCDAADSIQPMKGVKDEDELACSRACHLRDGAAMVRFQRELERRLAAGEALRECDVDEILYRYRSADEAFLTESFDTIAAWGPNAAMMHYAPHPGADSAIEPHGFLLVDSGTTCFDGTTDITRTYAVGPLTEREKQLYTLVLKCHIDMAMAVWLEGATGGELDMLARAPMWRSLLNYRCGTGHSVSFVGSVHEGPQQLRPHNGVVFVPGMTITDEPGVYEGGELGIRIENELECVRRGETEYGRFLAFRPLTMVPIDTTPVLPALLSAEERAWLDAYHRDVQAALAPLLNAEENAWLAARCAPLG